MGETQELAEFVASVGYDDIPDDALEHAKRAIRDYVGVALYGSHHSVGDAVYNYVETQYADGDVTVFQRDGKSAPAAALANGAFGHAIDYDDTFESIVIHPTSPIFAASLAASEESNAASTELLTGYVVGCEVAFRVGQSTYPEHYENGWHSTGTAGSFGAAGAAASIFDLTEDQIRTALGIVASSSSALKRNFGTMTKPLHAGHASQMGIRAALLARNGFTADTEIFEGEQGYNRVMTVDDAYDPDEIANDLYDSWAVTDIGFKPYPSGVITHAAMDAMRDLTREHDLTPDDVDSVVVTLEDAASGMLHHEQPDDALQAKFSIEFCLASILREGRAGIHEFTDEYVREPETRAAVEKVSRAFESDLFGDEYAGYGAIVRVTKTDGTELREEIRYAPGSPNNPIEDGRLERKFYECAQSRLSESEAAELERTILELEDNTLETFRSLVR